MNALTSDARQSESASGQQKNEFLKGYLHMLNRSPAQIDPEAEAKKPRCQRQEGKFPEIHWLQNQFLHFVPGDEYMNTHTPSPEEAALRNLLDVDLVLLQSAYLQDEQRVYRLYQTFESRMDEKSEILQQISHATNEYLYVVATRLTHINREIIRRYDEKHPDEREVDKAS